MKYFLAIAILATTLLSCNNNQKDGKDNLYVTESEDVEMNEAIAKAKQTFAHFDSAFLSNKFDTANFSIKVRFPTKNGGYEHIWATSLIKKDGDYFGIIDNLPELTTKVKQGDKIKINRDDISDWMYSDNGILHGGYTIKIIRSHMPKEEQNKFDSTFPFKIVD